MTILAGLESSAMISIDRGRSHPPEGVHLLIICPQRLIREGLRLMLAQEEDLHILALVMEPEQALRRLPKLKPDLVIFVQCLPDQDAVSEIQRLRAHLPGTPVIAISSEHHPQRVQAVLKAGASGYMPLDADPDELIHTVIKVAGGELTIHPSIAHGLLMWLAGGARAESRAVDDLTGREREVLAYVARGMSDHDIAQTMFLSVRTIQTHLSHIYEKLGVHSRTEAAVLALKEGWLDQGEAGSAHLSKR